jgi:hypothetical protein
MIRRHALLVHSHISHDQALKVFVTYACLMQADHTLMLLTGLASGEWMFVSPDETFGCF